MTSRGRKGFTEDDEISGKKFSRNSDGFFVDGIRYQKSQYYWLRKKALEMSPTPTGFAEPRRILLDDENDMVDSGGSPDTPPSPSDNNMTVESAWSVSGSFLEEEGEVREEESDIIDLEEESVFHRIFSLNEERNESESREQVEQLEVLDLMEENVANENSVWNDDEGVDDEMIDEDHLEDQLEEDNNEMQEEDHLDQEEIVLDREVGEFIQSLLSKVRWLRPLIVERYCIYFSTKREVFSLRNEDEKSFLSRVFQYRKDLEDLFDLDVAFNESQK